MLDKESVEQLPSITCEARADAHYLLSHAILLTASAMWRLPLGALRRAALPAGAVVALSPDHRRPVQCMIPGRASGNNVDTLLGMFQPPRATMSVAGLAGPARGPAPQSAPVLPGGEEPLTRFRQMSAFCRERPLADVLEGLGVPRDRMELEDLVLLGVSTAGETLDALDANRAVVRSVILEHLQRADGLHAEDGSGQERSRGAATHEPPPTDPVEGTVRLMRAACAAQSGDTETLDRMLRSATPGFHDLAAFVESSGSGVPSVHCVPTQAILAAHAAAVLRGGSASQVVPLPMATLDPRQSAGNRPNNHAGRWFVDWLLRWFPEALSLVWHEMARPAHVMSHTMHVAQIAADPTVDADVAARTALIYDAIVRTQAASAAALQPGRVTLADAFTNMSDSARLEAEREVQRAGLPQQGRGTRAVGGLRPQFCLLWIRGECSHEAGSDTAACGRYHGCPYCRSTSPTCTHIQRMHQHSAPSGENGPPTRRRRIGNGPAAGGQAQQLNPFPPPPPPRRSGGGHGAAVY